MPQLLPDHVGKSPTKQSCAWQEILLYSLQSAACFIEHRPAFLSIRAHTQQCAPLEVLESPLMSIACRINGKCLVYKPFQSALLRYQLRSLPDTVPIISAQTFLKRLGMRHSACRLPRLKMLVLLVPRCHSRVRFAPTADACYRPARHRRTSCSCCLSKQKRQRTQSEAVMAYLGLEWRKVGHFDRQT